MGVIIKKKAEQSPAVIPNEHYAFILEAAEAIKGGLPKEASSVDGHPPYPVGQYGLVDYIITLGYTEKYPTINLKMFANLAQTHAKKGMIISFYGVSMEDIVSAFCQKPKGEDLLVNPADPKSFVAFFKL